MKGFFFFLKKAAENISVSEMQTLWRGITFTIGPLKKYQSTKYQYHGTVTAFLLGIRLTWNTCEIFIWSNNINDINTHIAILIVIFKPDKLVFFE